MRWKMSDELREQIRDNLSQKDIYELLEMSNGQIWPLKF
jgi:hypothetical protein